MKLKIFSIYDHKAQQYNSPVFLSTEGQAIRLFGDQANEQDSPIAKHPEDYSLFLLGEFTDDDGLFVPITPPKKLGDALEHIKQ